MRLIDADTLKPKLKAIIEAETQVYGRGSWGFAVRCMEVVEDAPTIEPERKTGRWINAYPDIEPNPMFMYGICSECGFDQSISDKLNYCPNCGADMRGEKNETD